ncbi:hypothetical protein BC835DRAFT_1309541 [Cytidiella melzeri]|nr:hypothetical protein BC835DRAFT_1309541 [Cytidiella melzeri]
MLRETERARTKLLIENTLPTLLSAPPHSPLQKTSKATVSDSEPEHGNKKESQTNTALSQGDSLFSPVRGGATKKRGGSARGMTRSQSTPGIPEVASENRFELLGQTVLTSNGAVNESTALPPPVQLPTATALEHPRRKKQRRESLRPAQQGRSRNVKGPNAKAMKRGILYSGRDSRLAGYRASGCQECRVSKLSEAQELKMEEDAEWRERVATTEAPPKMTSILSPQTEAQMMHPRLDVHTLSQTTPTNSPCYHRSGTSTRYSHTNCADGTAPTTKNNILVPEEDTAIPRVSPAIPGNNGIHKPAAPMVTDDKGPQTITQSPTPHEPICMKLEGLEFTFPAENSEPPRENNPCYAYNNLYHDQTRDWPRMTGHSFLVQMVGKGILRAHNGVQRLHLNHGGHTALCPYFPVFDSLVGSIDGFDAATADQLHALVKKAFNNGNLNTTLQRIIKGQDLGDKLTMEEAIAQTRRSLGI